MSEEWELAGTRWRAQQVVMKEMVRVLGGDVGYGNMMHLARDCWREHLRAEGYPEGGEFAVGPCVSMTVPCGCASGRCDWCCGSGWVTARVKRAKDAAGEEG